MSYVLSTKLDCPKCTFEMQMGHFIVAGHTFMSADSFHHQVELSLKRKHNDFKFAVHEANSSKVDVCEMDITNFFDWENFTSQHKLKKISPRPYLHDFVHVQFTRGEKIIKYKNDFSAEFRELNFPNAKAMKTKLPKPKARVQCKGISAERKENLISKLKPISLSFGNH